MFKTTLSQHPFDVEKTLKRHSIKRKNNVLCLVVVSNVVDDVSLCMSVVGLVSSKISKKKQKKRTKLKLAEGGSDAASVHIYEI